MLLECTVKKVYIVSFMLRYSHITPWFGWNVEVHDIVTSAHRKLL